MLSLLATSLFTLPDGFMGSSTAYIGGLIGDLAPILVVIFGISLGMIVIKFLLGLVKRRA
jgi:hypothetical protein